MAASQAIEQATVPEVKPRRGGRGRQVLGGGCLFVMLFACVATGIVAGALQQGGLRLDLPGGNTLKAGSEDFVLSNYSFQKGTTYYFDLAGNGARHILEVQRLTDSNTLELVFHFADRASTGEKHLVTLPLP